MSVDLRLIGLLTIFFYFILKKLTMALFCNRQKKQKNSAYIMDWNKGELGEVKFPLNEFFQTVCGKPHEKIYVYTLAEKLLLPSNAN